jgi:hypothetical protein
MKLYFENRFGEEREIAEIKTSKAINDVGTTIKEFLSNYPNFKSYYTIVNFYDNYIQYDVGSHTEFFNLRGTAEEIEEVKKEYYK